MLSDRDSAVVMNVTQSIFSGIESLTPVARHVYDVAVKQVQLEANFILVASLFSAFICFIAWLNAWPRANSYWEENRVVFAVISSVIFLLLLVFGTSWAYPAICNPEWAAMQRITGMLK